jgi:hypothetical protein
LRSSAEAEIRDAGVAKLRRLYPQARIIHELNCAGSGSNRIDVAAVAPDQIIAVEIKSAKDKLDRLTSQVSAFERCCHEVLIVAHTKFFAKAEPFEGLELSWPDRRNHHRSKVWMYPEPERDAPYPTSNYVWRAPEQSLYQPHAYAMLEMLWAEELRWLCGAHRIGAGKRPTCATMAAMLAYHLTGKEIAEGVCEMLRWRNFTEADPATDPNSERFIKGTAP